MLPPCDVCRTNKAVVKGRAFDGRRAYRCNLCGRIWTQGLQGRGRRYQREGFQFADSKSSKTSFSYDELLVSLGAEGRRAAKKRIKRGRAT